MDRIFFQNDCDALFQSFVQAVHHCYGSDFASYFCCVVSKKHSMKNLGISMESLSPLQLQHMTKCCGLALDIVTMVQNIHKTLAYFSRYDAEQNKKNDSHIVCLDCYLVIQSQETLVDSFDKAWQYWLDRFYQYREQNGVNFAFDASILHEFQVSCIDLLNHNTMMEHLSLEQAYLRIQNSYGSYWKQAHGFLSQHEWPHTIETSYVLNVKFEDYESDFINKILDNTHQQAVPLSYPSQKVSPHYFSCMMDAFFDCFQHIAQSVFQKKLQNVLENAAQLSALWHDYIKIKESLAFPYKNIWIFLHDFLYSSKEEVYLLIANVHSQDRLIAVYEFLQGLFSKKIHLSMSFENPESLKKSTTILRCFFLKHPTACIRKIVIANAQHAKNQSFWSTHVLLYHTQDDLVLLKKELGIHFDIVQSRSGSVARGSIPTRCLIANTLFDSKRLYLGLFFHADALRQRFSSPSISAMTLMRYVQEVLHQDKKDHIDPRLKKLQADISDHSLNEVRYYTFEQPDLIDYFYALTPADYLGSKQPNIDKIYQIDKLKSTLWFGCWSQSRFFLPFWLGLSDVLRQIPDVNSDEGKLLLSDPSMLGLYTVISIGIYRVNLEIVQAYEEYLVSAHLKEFGEHLRDRFGKMLALKERFYILDNDLYLKNFKDDILWRDLYLYPLHASQILLLRHARQDWRFDRWKEMMKESMLLLGLGLQNSI